LQKAQFQGLILDLAAIFSRATQVQQGIGYSKPSSSLASSVRFDSSQGGSKVSLR
jgi:hypothetical protein